MAQILALSDSKSRSNILSGIVDRDDGFRMPPPDAVKRLTKLKRKLPSKIVLEEDAYVEALSHIIERDYFPDTAKLRKHLELLNAHDANNIAAISALHREILTEQRRSQATPYSSQYGKGESWEEIVKTNPAGSDGSRNVCVDDMNVDNFLRVYTSEDNDSFEKLQEKDLEKWRKARHWAYENYSEEVRDVKQRPGMLMLYHMDGKVLTVEERQRFDSLLELPVSIGDERSNNLDTWRFRVRNNFMFPPDLNDGIEVQTNGSDNISTASICNASSLTTIDLTVPDSSSSAVQWQAPLNLVKTSNKWVGSSIRPQKVIQRNNTNLRIRPDAPALTYVSSGITPSPLEPPHTPSVQSDSMSDSSSVAYGKTDDRVSGGNGIRKYRTISMTPSPMPGGNGGSPLMTWGVIGGTPLILDPSTITSGGSESTVADMTCASYGRSLLLNLGDEKGFNGIAYRPPPIQQRELLALALVAKEKSRRSATKSGGMKKVISSSGNALKDGSPNSNRLDVRHGSSSSSRGSRAGSGSVLLSSQQRRFQQMTPNAQSLAARLSCGNSNIIESSSRSNPFGSDALSLSYSNMRSLNSHRAITGPERINKHSRESCSRSERHDNSNTVTSTRLPNESLNTDNLLNV